MALGNESARFDSKEAKAELEASDKGVDLEFTYENQGDMPIAIEGFEESCGCLTGSWDGELVEPGGRGKIKARFEALGLRGKVRKSLIVNFVGGGKVELTGEMLIHDALEISERTLRWDPGSEPTEKSIDIKVRTSYPIKVSDVLGEEGGFEVKWETLAEGRSYRIRVKPANTRTNSVNVIQVRTDSKNPRDSAFAVFAVVGPEAGQGGGS